MGLLAAAEWYSGGWMGSIPWPGDAEALGVFCMSLIVLAWVPVATGLAPYLARDRIRFDDASYTILCAGTLTSAWAMATWKHAASVEALLRSRIC